MNYRNLRVAKLIQEELSKIILREIDFENSTIVTIINVGVDSKLERARVFVGVVSPAGSEEVLDLLKKKTPFLQRLLLKKINIKPMPRIEFVLSADK